mgnify:CR=1 FL=1
METHYNAYRSMKEHVILYAHLAGREGSDVTRNEMVGYLGSQDVFQNLSLQDFVAKADGAIDELVGGAILTEKGMAYRP